MRLRFVPGARELIQDHPELIYDDITHEEVYLDNFFPTNQPLAVEIGMGKGQFIFELAKNNPHINFIGIEKYDSAIVRALEKLIEDPLDNLRLIRMDAMYLFDLFEAESITTIYLNFSDPWPKLRHSKRRLTSDSFLSMYEGLLVPNGEVHFKTDNDDLFSYSIDSMTEYGMEFVVIHYDYHNETNEPIITTEFEDKFVEQGVPIKHLIARFKEEQDG